MLALLPLDDRPCNDRFPQQIAAIGGDVLATAPPELLGHFNTAGQCGPLGQWLLALPHVEALIVSIDMLAYGGLVASRKDTLSLQAALDNLQAVRTFRQQRPATPIYAFNILMRLAVTMDSDEAAANYYNVMRYARLVDEAERFSSQHLRGELERVQAEIPPAVLAQYLAARARNHQINHAMLDWLGESIFDYLLITQEDASEFGLHRREQDALLNHVTRLGLENKMSLHPGADEAALTLLARHWNTGVSFRLHGSGRADMERIALFEDRPYHQALRQHVAAMHGVLYNDGAGEMQASGEAPTSTVAPAQAEAGADFELFVNAPVGGSQKDESAPAQAARRLQLAPFIEEMLACAAAGERVALCDVAFPNGADNLLLGELDKRRALGKLCVFGGWNTAGNTTGTVLAQCAALRRALRAGQVPASTAQLNRQFTVERIIDDWLYQSQVRARIEKAARERGLSPLNMGSAAAAPIEAATRRELLGLAQMTAKKHFGAAIAGSDITLPWGRTFEADVRLQLS